MNTTGGIMLQNTAFYVKGMERTLRNTLENRRQILVIDTTPGAYRIPVSYHDCAEREPLERCVDCYADYVDGKQQLEEDLYREV
jgi:hypothetical protein